MFMTNFLSNHANFDILIFINLTHPPVIFEDQELKQQAHQQVLILFSQHAL